MMNKRLTHALLMLTMLFIGASSATADKPNVVMILIDDMGWMDSSTYGSKYYQTPNLSRLAKEGMRFTNAYAASPLCSPTRASIMSGQFPARMKLTVAITPKCVAKPKALPAAGKNYCGLVQGIDRMPLEVYTLAEALKAGGYNTAHIGKWHLAPYKNGHKFYADNQGFDYVIGGGHLPGPPDYYSPYRNGIRNLKAGPKGEYLNERLAQESIKWITSVKDSGKPFFLNFWQYAVHGPFIPKKDLMPKYQKLRDPQADQRCPEMATMLESMDTSIGILLDWLDKPENKALKDNTLIILTSDNGGVTHKELSGGNTVTSNRPLRGGKANTYEGGVREPWIVSWPGKVKPGTVCETPVQTTDIYPTVLEAVGLKPKKGIILDGESIVPLLEGKPMKQRPIFTDFQHVMGILNASSSSVRLGDWKLIRYFHAGRKSGSHGYELFDLKRDPYESIDLASYLPEKVKELDKLIEAHLKDTKALIPLRNPKFSGNPRRRRSNPKKAPNRPQKLSLSKSNLRVRKAGSQRFQLIDQNNKPRKTHALVLEGADWVRTKSNPDGSIEVMWNRPGKSATVLFGWKGGSTVWEVNDWTIPPCKLVIEKGK